jgi:TonB family protein
MTGRSHLHSITIGEALIALAAWPAPAASQRPVKSTPIPVMSSRTPPPWPAISRELGEQGVTTLQVAVARDGRAGGVKITGSSGFPRLDQAAAGHVRENYLWQPLARAPAKTTVRIVWDLGSAQNRRVA